MYSAIQCGFLLFDLLINYVGADRHYTISGICATQNCGGFMPPNKVDFEIIKYYTCSVGTFHYMAVVNNHYFQWKYIATPTIVVSPGVITEPLPSEILAFMTNSF